MSHHYHDYIRIYTQGDSGFWGAFAGAFFAFVFGLITYIATKRREKFVLHRNALVKLERILNKHLDDFATLQHVATNMRAVFAVKKTPTNKLFLIELNKSLDMEICSIKLMNEFLVYQIAIDRLNFNITTINHVVTRMEDLFISGQGVLDNNFTHIVAILDSLLIEIPKLIEKTKGYLVKDRLHLKLLNTQNSYISGVLNGNWDFDISEKELKAEKAILEKEIIENYSEDNNK